MDIFTLAQACVRRWWVFVPLIAITVVVTVVQGRNIKPDYSQSAQVVLVPPSSIPANSARATSVPVNPLGGISTTQAVLVAQLNASTAQSAVARKAKAGGGFSAVAEKIGGIIALTASAPSGNGTTATLKAAITQVGTTLKQLQTQAHTPTTLFISTLLISADPVVTVAYPHRGRNLTLIAIAGVVISVFVAQLVDFLFMRRKRSPSRHAVEEYDPLDPLDPFVTDSSARSVQG